MFVLSFCHIFCLGFVEFSATFGFFPRTYTLYVFIFFVVAFFLHLLEFCPIFVVMISPFQLCLYANSTHKMCWGSKLRNKMIT